MGYKAFVSGTTRTPQSNDCMICQKHQDFRAFTAEPLFENSQIVLSHFPILSGQPAYRGHLLLEPKRHIRTFSELTDPEYASLTQVIRLAEKSLIETLHVENVLVFKIGEAVHHMHIHLIPRYPEVPTEFRGFKILDWKDAPKIGMAEIIELSSRLRKVIQW